MLSPYAYFTQPSEWVLHHSRKPHQDLPLLAKRVCVILPLALHAVVSIVESVGMSFFVKAFNICFHCRV